VESCGQTELRSRRRRCEGDRPQRLAAPFDNPPAPWLARSRTAHADGAGARSEPLAQVGFFCWVSRLPCDDRCRQCTERRATCTRAWAVGSSIS